jgi:hypothetical protein
MYNEMKHFNRPRFAPTLFAVLLILVAGFAAAPARTQQFGELDASRVQQIAGMLTAQPAGFGVPCSDRAAWTAKTAALQSFVPEAEQILTKPLPPFDPDGYLAFTKTGDRAPMERNLHQREDQLVPLVLAECVEYKGRFLPRIAEVMSSLVAQPSWTLSAHDPQLLNFHGVRYYVDLNAADMGDTLAQTLYLLGNKIPAETRATVTAGMEKHVFGPMRQSFLAGGPPDNHTGNLGHWWLHADMNWNAVCIKGVTGAALAILPDVNDRAMFVAGAEHYIQHYDKGFGDDGYDTEGLGYWNYGFSHFIELRENLFRATGGKIDLLADEKMQRVSMFGLQFPMLPNNSAAYGDAGRMPRADEHLVAMIDHIFKIPQAAALPVKSSGMQHVGLTSISLDLFPVEGDQLVSATAQEVSHPTLQTYYADSGVLVSRPAPGQNFAVTIKAGGNTTHSHNDVGSFVLGMDDTQPIGDPGGPGFYNQATFSAHRLDFKLMNSFGHPVPEIGGNLQLDATTVKVSVPAHSFSDAADSITIDMTNAYKVPELKSVTRTLVHSRAGAGSVAITDDFNVTGPTEIIESIPTHGTWEKVNDHTLLIKFDGQQVRAVVEAPVPFTFSETKVDEYRNPFTRIEVHLPLTASGKVTVTYTPVK